MSDSVKSEIMMQNTPGNSYFRGVFNNYLFISYRCKKVQIILAYYPEIL